MIEITSKKLTPTSLIQQLAKNSNGAIVTFQGTVRSPSQGKEVLYLEYETYRGMAEAKLQQIVKEIEERWHIQDIAIYHRTGKIKVEETALLVVVAAPHRREAFEACQYAVDRVKQIAPIWKKEVFVDGAVWVEHQD